MQILQVYAEWLLFFDNPNFSGESNINQPSSCFEAGILFQTVKPKLLHNLQPIPILWKSMPEPVDTPSSDFYCFFGKIPSHLLLFSIIWYIINQ